MFLEFSEIPAEGLELERSVALSEAAEDGGKLLVGPARLVGEARSGERGIELEGRVDARVRLQCCRCLEIFETPLSGSFSLVVVSDAVEFGSGEHRTDPADMMLFYAEQGRVDLREVTREQVYLNLPLKPICREDCAGLCPTCGVNRNRIECGCRPLETDPRLAPLLELKKRMGGNDGEPEA